MSRLSIVKDYEESDTHSEAERREHRRHDMENQSIPVRSMRKAVATPAKTSATIVDISAGGVRIRTSQQNVKPDNQIRVRLELPAYAGICPFIASQGKSLAPKSEWGRLDVRRPRQQNQQRRMYDVAGRLVDMDEMDRGMLGLYLSSAPGRLNNLRSQIRDLK